MRRVLLHRRSGQSLVIVVLAMAAMFMVIGLGIDGGLLYAHRRLMQNTADSACLAASSMLSVGGNQTAAENAAVAVIQQNLGPTGPGTGANAPGTLTYTSIADVYSPDQGTGAGLTRGIEFSGPQVRVALESPAFTYFVRLLGQPEYTVAARARCDAISGGGGTPFAIARWRAYDNSTDTDPVRGISTDVSLADQDDDVIIRDVLAQEASSLITEWPDWGTTDYPGTPESGTGIYSQASPAASADPNVPGFEIPIAGADANSNVGDNSFTGPVLLDIRNITYAPETYGGLNAAQAASTNKDFIYEDILKGYDGPFIPPGTQLGYTSGVNANLVHKAFDTRYNVGDVVSVLVYNGTVYGETDFTNSFVGGDDDDTKPALSAGYGAGAFPTDCNIDAYANSYAFEGPVNDYQTSASTSPLAFNVNVQPTTSGVGGSGPDDYSSNFRMRAFASVNGDTWNLLQTKWDGGWLGINAQGYAGGTSGTVGIDMDGYAWNLQVQQSDTDVCTYAEGPLEDLDGNSIPGEVLFDGELPRKPVQGAFTLYLESEDTATRQRRGQYAFVNMGAANNDFYAYMPGIVAYEVVTVGTNQTLKQQVNIEEVDGTVLQIGPGANDPKVTGYQWFNSSGTAVAAPTGLSALLKKQGGSNELQITIGPTAPVDTTYHLRVAITHQGRTHWIWYYLPLRSAINSSIDSFVYALGYANFRITQITTNSIWGEAVSGLIFPEEDSGPYSGQVLAGLQPRLLPWEE